MHWLAIDGNIVIADDFAGSSEKESHIAEANMHLAAGDHKKAMEELKLA